MIKSGLFLFGQGDREAIIEGAAAYDLIVCGYGLLQAEQERLTSIHWETIVADWIEYSATNRAVGGSNPPECARKTKTYGELVASGKGELAYAETLYSIHGALGYDSSLTDKFLVAVQIIADRLGADPNHLMAFLRMKQVIVLIRRKGMMLVIGWLV